MVSVSEQIRKARRAADLTQRELAERICMARSQLAAIETGRHNPSLSMLERISEALNIPVSSFFKDVPSTIEAYYRLENEEIKLLDKFRMLSKAKRETLLETLDYLISLTPSKPKEKIWHKDSRKTNNEISINGGLFSNNGKVSVVNK